MQKNIISFQPDLKFIHKILQKIKPMSNKMGSVLWRRYKLGKYHVECTDRHLNVDKLVMWKALGKSSIYNISDNLYLYDKKEIIILPFQSDLKFIQKILQKIKPIYQIKWGALYGEDINLVQISFIVLIFLLTKDAKQIGLF
jgi:hypothetical protein